MLLSIILPAYNEAKVLPHTIANLRSAIVASEWASISWEIILCDNNSTDNTPEIAK